MCNSPDSLIQSTICKHVHLLQRVLQLEENKENCDAPHNPLSDGTERKKYAKEEVLVLASNMPNQLEKNDAS